MKKFMIAILLLIPLIIVLTINVSGKIISATVKISVENIFLLNKGLRVSNEIIDLNDYLKSNKYYLLEVEYFPRLAEQKGIVWESDDEGIATVKDGKVYFHNYGTVNIYAYSKSNINAKASCYFFITGDKINSIDIIEYGKEIVAENIDIGLKERKLLSNVIIPANALQDKIIRWYSSDENIVSVDVNGVIKGNSEGTAVIRAEVMEEGQLITDTVTVNVGGYNSLFNEETVTIGGDTIDLNTISNMAIDNIVIESGEATLQGNTVQYNGIDSGSVKLIATHNGNEHPININFTKGKKVLGFKNLDILKKGLWKDSNFIWSNSANLSLIPTVLNIDYDGAMPQIVWSVSDETVINIVDNRLYAKKGGNVTLKASAQGFVDAEIILEVKIPMQSVNLELNNKEDKRGLGEQRVFGVKTYHYNENGSYIDNTYQMKIQSFNPVDAEEVYDFFSSDTSLATVDNNGLVTFNDNAVGQKVIISVQARYAVSAFKVRDYYEFTLVDGVNIGTEVKPQDNTELNPNFNIYKAVQSVVQEAIYNLVFQNDVYYPSQENGGSWQRLRKNIYGNGYKIDGQFYTNENVGGLFGIDMYYFDEGDELVISNLNIQNARAVDDFMEYVEKGKTAIDIGAPNEEYAKNKSVRIEYCLFQYAYTHIFHYAGKLILNGCILRNTAGPTVSARSNDNSGADTTFNNCIFSNVIAPVYISYCPDLVNNKESKPIKFRLKGNIYIYNWKEVKDIRVDVLNSSAGDVGAQINAIINDAIRKEFMREEFDTIKYRNDLKNYINFSFLHIGLWKDISDYEMDFETDKFKYFEADLAGQYPAFKNMMKYKSSLILPLNPDGKPTTLPGETYELDTITLDRLHGRTKKS